MTREEFKSKAGLKDKLGKAKTSDEGRVTQFRPPAHALNAPTPKPPFGLPAMPVVAKLKVLPTVTQGRNKEESSFLRSDTENE